MSNATKRAEEIRDLITQQVDLDPFFVARVLKLCRMHENLDETIEDERQRLISERDKAAKFKNRERADYERLITRVHNQRMEINRLHRIVDEFKASESPATSLAAQPEEGGGSEPGSGVPGDDGIRGEEVQPTLAQRFAGVKASVSQGSVPTSEGEL